MANDWLLMLPELVLLAGILTVPFVGDKNRAIRPVLTLSALLGSLACVTWLLWGRADQTIAGYDDHSGILFGFFEVTAFALFFKFVFLLVSSLVLLVSAEYTRTDRDPTEYYVLLLAATFGMLIVASARDLITLFIGIETTALTSFALVGYRRTHLANAEGATKFFIIGSLSAGITLYGISLVYAVAGTVDIYELAGRLADAPGDVTLLLAVGFLIAGFGFEISTVPFHMWAPDVYDGAPDTVSALLAASGKKMGFAALLKVFLVGLIAVKFQWEHLIGILAVLTMTVGNLAALQQRTLKRMLAWSSIAQAGYILIALPVGTNLAIAGALLHILTHALMKGGAFVILAVLAVRGIGDALENFRGLGRRAPLAAFTLTLTMFSLAGLPPLAGFVSKFILFSSAIDVGLDEGRDWLIWLAVAGILNSALSLYYYARVVRTLYVDDAAEGSATLLPKLSAGGVAACVIVIVGLVLFGVWPQPLVEFAMRAAGSLVGTTGSLTP